jgi:raffinose/stachyose/melibiose transport system permease protein
VKNLFSDKKTIAILTIPSIAIIGFAILAPLVVSLYFSFMEWAGFGAASFIGLENYRQLLLHDATFYRSLFNTFLLMVVTIFLQNPFAFIVAAILTKLKDSLSRTLRTIYFIPATLSLVVVTKLWTNIFNPSYGFLNKLLQNVGFGTVSIAWLSDPRTALGSVIWIMVWQGFGWALLFYFSGLMTVPKELEEAATVDGANKFQLYTKIILPYMIPVIQSVIVIDVISSLKQMEMVYLSTEGGPGDLTQFIAVYLYQKAFRYSEYGYGNAISVIFVILAVVLTVLIQRLFAERSPLSRRKSL